MAQLLVVETSPRGDRSVSRRLTRRFEAAWRDAHPGATVVRRDLTETELPFVTLPWIAANFTPAAELSAEMRAVLRQSDLLVGELMAADHVAIGTPVYNYNVPAALKAWIDHVVRRGVTLGLDGKGLVTGKRATVLMASGGVYTEGSPIRERDIATQYLRVVLGSIGIGDVAFVAGGNAKSVDLGQVGMEDFVAGFEPAIAAAARAGMGAAA